MTELKAGEWHWFALHGGAGVSTVDQLHDLGHEFHQGVSAGPDGPVIAVCRTHAHGLLRAQDFATYAEGRYQVLGLLTIADTPGRLPVGLRKLRRHVAGAYQYAWELSWVEAWRCGEPVSTETAPRAARGVLRQIESRVSASTRSAGPTPVTH